MSRDIFHQPRVLPAPSNLALNPAREGAATASLGSLGQGLTTLTGKNFFPISHLNLPSVSSEPFPLVLSLHRCRGGVSRAGTRRLLLPEPGCSPAPLPRAAAPGSALALAEGWEGAGGLPRVLRGATSSCSSHGQSSNPSRHPQPLACPLPSSRDRENRWGRAPHHRLNRNLLQPFASRPGSSLVPPSCEKPQQAARAGRALTLCLSGSTNRMPK